MAELDRLVGRVAGSVQQLPYRAVALLYLAAATALRGCYDEWLEHTRGAASAVITDGFDSLYGYVLTGSLPVESQRLLTDLEQAVPPGESADAYSSTAAQDCVMCLDAGLRQALGGIEKGDAVWYALEPILQAVTERLFGVADVGSDDEDRDMPQVLASSEMRHVVEFFEWAAAFLRREDAPSESVISEVLTRAQVLTP